MPKLSDTTVELATTDRTAEGYWCLHCETCTRIEDMDVRQEHMSGTSWWDGFCPECGTSTIDHFQIAGDFQTGEEVEIGSDRFLLLREPFIPPPLPTRWDEVASFGSDISVDGGPWEPYWCNIETNSRRKVNSASVAAAIKDEASLRRTGKDTTRIRVRGTWWDSVVHRPEDED